MFLQGILEIEQDSTNKTKQDIQDSNSFYPYHSSYPHLASQDKNAGVETIKEREESEKEEDLSGIEVVGKDDIADPLEILQEGYKNTFGED